MISYPWVVWLMPLMLLSLLPFIYIESYILKFCLDASKKDAISGVAVVGNIVAVVVIQVILFLMFFCPILPSWTYRLPYLTNQVLNKEFLLGMFYWLLPFFILTFLIKLRIAVKILQRLWGTRVIIGMFVSHTLEYALVYLMMYLRLRYFQ
jgi:hypothetical protein